MSTTMSQDVHSVTVIRLLAGRGFDDERCDNKVEVAIDRFDQWTNPRGAVALCTCSRWLATEGALKRAA
ncbi:hypothetical protein [Actinophytocola sp.]|uniref:hypothetical protein n=1 Tax=Actinophytocola sp. TaxID=1872138 RepID=UPI002D808F1B|nr:hypothetical protein [Actinophytocola sp.]HET9138396.1 hypothetical protein [Actinophytocola sp.]